MARLNFKTFRNRFQSLVIQRAMTWEVVGFLGLDGQVYPFGTDTKVISTVFEAFSGPLVGEIAAEFGYDVEGSPQTIYPDFTLTFGGKSRDRIAVDIKTTFRNVNAKGQLKPFRYTLGSYTSFLRSPTATKNIRYPYAEYMAHWVIGFLYTRVDGVPAKVYRRENVSQPLCPYKDVEFFVQEKYKIVGESPGSGNTANIGSFPTANIQDLHSGNGPFSKVGKDTCDEYWRHYGKSKAARKYETLSEFLTWKSKTNR